MSNDISELLREILTRVDTAEAGRPASTPDWARIEQLTNHPARHRPSRRRITMLATALAVVLVVFGVLSGVPHRLFAEQATPAKTEGPVLGPELSSAWQQTLRQRAVSEGMIAIGFESGVLAPPVAGSIDVVFARDVGPYRMALVRGTWTVRDNQGGATGAKTVLQRWFAGPAGAAADQLEDGAVSIGSASEARVTSQVVQAGAVQKSIPAMRATGVAVVIASSGRPDVRLAGPAEYAADGSASLRLGPALSASARGVYVTAIPADGAHRLIIDGSKELGTGLVVPVRRVKEFDSSGTQLTMMGDEQAADLSRSVGAAALPALPATAQRGGPVPPRVVLDKAARLVQSRSGLALASSRLDLISALPFYGAAGQVTEWTVLITATAPSGARFAGVAQVLADGRMLKDDLDAWTLVPSGSLDDLALAWPSAGWGEQTVKPSSLIRFLGPRAATRAEILGTQGQVVSQVPLTGQVVTDGGAAHVGMKGVRFLDAAGKLLVQVPVGPYAGGLIPLPMDSWPEA